MQKLSFRRKTFHARDYWKKLQFTIRSSKLEENQRRKYHEIQIQALEDAQKQFLIDGEYLTDQELGQVKPTYTDDSQLYSRESLIIRYGLRRHPDVIKGIQFLWNFQTDRDELGCLLRESYVEFYIRVAKYLDSSFDDATTRATVEEEWENDRKGHETMSYGLFFDSLFQLADLWVDSLDPKEYVLFLQGIASNIFLPDGETYRLRGLYDISSIVESDEGISDEEENDTELETEVWVVNDIEKISNQSDQLKKKNLKTESEIKNNSKIKEPVKARQDQSIKNGNPTSNLKQNHLDTKSQSKKLPEKNNKSVNRVQGITAIHERQPTEETPKDFVNNFPPKTHTKLHELNKPSPLVLDEVQATESHVQTKHTNSTQKPNTIHPAKKTTKLQKVVTKNEDITQHDVEKHAITVQLMGFQSSSNTIDTHEDINRVKKAAHGAMNHASHGIKIEDDVTLCDDNSRHSNEKNNINQTYEDESDYLSPWENQTTTCKDWSKAECNTSQVDRSKFMLSAGNLFNGQRGILKGGGLRKIRESTAESKNAFESSSKKDEGVFGTSISIPVFEANQFRYLAPLSSTGTPSKGVLFAQTLNIGSEGSNLQQLTTNSTMHGDEYISLGTNAPWSKSQKTELDPIFFKKSMQTTSITSMPDFSSNSLTNFQNTSDCNPALSSQGNFIPSCDTQPKSNLAQLYSEHSKIAAILTINRKEYDLERNQHKEKHVPNRIGMLKQKQKIYRTQNFAARLADNSILWD